MPFGKKTTQVGIKEQFSLILNPVRGELSKSRMIERMVQVFPLAIDEASDLVDNTPIILLEGLELETGEQVKNYFRETGADLVLTDDHTFKRKCFRAIWPTPPKFDFLNPPSSKNSEPSSFQVFTQERPSVPGFEVRNDRDSQARTVFEEQVPKIKGNPLPLDPVIPIPVRSHADSLTLMEKDSGIETSIPAEEAWQKGELQRVESATNRAIQDEKIAFLTHEKEKLQGLIQKLQKENDELKTEQLRALQFKKDLDELRLTLSQLETERVRLSEEVKTHQLEESSLTEKLRALEANREAYLKEKQNELRLLETRFEQNEARLREENAKLEAQVADLRVTVQSQKLEFDHINEKLKTTAYESKNHESEFGRLKNETTSLRAENEELKRMLAESQQNVVQQKKEFEMVRMNLEEKAIGKAAEVDSWRKKSEEWASVHSGLVRELEALRQKNATEMESLSSRNRELQSQLEIAQRQVREFTTLTEQQDLVNKRNRIAMQLSDKETRLRELNRRQEMLQNDLRERQQVFDTTISEREGVEKEILKDRQAQKYLLEQLKLKEKSRLSIVDRFNRLKERPPDPEEENNQEAKS